MHMFFIFLLHVFLHPPSPCISSFSFFVHFLFILLYVCQLPSNYVLIPTFHAYLQSSSFTSLVYFFILLPLHAVLLCPPCIYSSSSSMNILHSHILILSFSHLLPYLLFLNAFLALLHGFLRHLNPQCIYSSPSFSVNFFVLLRAFFFILHLHVFLHPSSSSPHFFSILLLPSSHIMFLPLLLYSFSYSFFKCFFILHLRAFPPPLPCMSSSPSFYMHIIIFLLRAFLPLFLLHVLLFHPHPLPPCICLPPSPPCIFPPSSCISSSCLPCIIFNFLLRVFIPPPMPISSSFSFFLCFSYSLSVHFLHPHPQ